MHWGLKLAQWEGDCSPPPSLQHVWTLAKPVVYISDTSRLFPGCPNFTWYECKIVVCFYTQQKLSKPAFPSQHLVLCFPIFFFLMFMLNSLLLHMNLTVFANHLNPWLRELRIRQNRFTNSNFATSDLYWHVLESLKPQWVTEIQAT